MDNFSKAPVPSELYDDYYYENFNRGSDGITNIENFHQVFTRAIKLLGAHEGNLVLDIGCGRGELLTMLAKLRCSCVGIDYSKKAVNIANDVISTLLDEKERVFVKAIEGNAKKLNFDDSVFDKVVMLDIVEHLHENELDLVYSEVYRVLKPGGMALIHTNPNKWCMYPVKKLASLVGVTLKSAPFHVNEQSVLSLKRQLKQDFSISKFLMFHDHDFWFNATTGRSSIIRSMAKIYDKFLGFYGIKFLVKNTYLKYIFYSDIWVYVTKK
jgi:ubiquinone/menaquinone biosynthesis C-methylase UbiE